MASEGEPNFELQVEECTRELAQNAKALSREVLRLQQNLKKLHEFQNSLLVVCQQWMQWLERADKLPRETVTREAEPQ